MYTGVGSEFFFSIILHLSILFAGVRFECVGNELLYAISSLFAHAFSGGVRMIQFSFQLA